MFLEMESRRYRVGRRFAGEHYTKRGHVKSVITFER